MLTGAHTIIFAEDAGKAREFLRDVLKLPAVDAGEGWLIMGLPPGEVACHPCDDDQAPGTHALYLMCDDIQKTMADLKAKGVEFTSPAADRGWGILTNFKIPGAGEIGLYQPRHARPPQFKA